MLRKRVHVQFVVEIENDTPHALNDLVADITHDVQRLLFSDHEKDSVHVTIEREDP
jgi:hypothetical protein